MPRVGNNKTRSPSIKPNNKVKSKRPSLLKKVALMVLASLIVIGGTGFYVNRRQAEGEARFNWTEIPARNGTIKVCIIPQANKFRVRISPNNSNLEYVDYRITSQNHAPHEYPRIERAKFNAVITRAEVAGNSPITYIFTVKNTNRSEEHSIRKSNINDCDVPDPPAVIPTGTVRQLAQRILNNHNITFDPDPARTPFVQLSRGQPALVNGNNTSRTSTAVDPKILVVILALADDGPIRITRLTTGTHGANSEHYYGRAVDINDPQAPRVLPFAFNNRRTFGIQDIWFTGRQSLLRYNLNDGTPCNGACSGIDPHTTHLHIGV